jgi:Ice-binding-like
MNDLQKYFSKSLLATATLLIGASTAFAANTPSLGAASDFAILSAAPGHGGAVTCTDSAIDGDVGSSGPKASVTQTRCTITGAIIAPVSANVLKDFNSAYGQYAGIPCTGTLLDAYGSVQLTLTPGVYCTTAALTFTGTTLILNGGSNDTWLFKIGTSGAGALTATDSSVVMAGDACNVTWWAAQAATVTRGDFEGTILAGAAITMTGVAPATPFEGQALAKAAVTLTDMAFLGCEGGTSHGKPHQACNQGVGNGPEGCDPGNSNQGNILRSNDELGGVPGKPGRKGG